MLNREKLELKREIYELVKKNYQEKEAIKILVEYGYCQSTAKRYWRVFYEKYRNELNEGQHSSHT